MIVHALIALAATVALTGSPADSLAPLPPDPLRYDYAHRCLGHAQRGTKLLEAWLTAHWAGESWGIVRCEKFVGRPIWSLHSEGRALDWRLDAGRPAERRAALRLIGMLLAPDRTGTPTALARRMGVQEIIFDCRSWYAGAAGMGSYSVCRSRGVDRTTAHRDHVHIGLNWPGARAQTSFWRSALARA
jgi:hypothetical protein